MVVTQSRRPLASVGASCRYCMCAMISAGWCVLGSSPDILFVAHGAQHPKARKTARSSPPVNLSFAQPGIWRGELPLAGVPADLIIAATGDSKLTTLRYAFAQHLPSRPMVSARGGKDIALVDRLRLPAMGEREVCLRAPASLGNPPYGGLS